MILTSALLLVLQVAAQPVSLAWDMEPGDRFAFESVDTTWLSSEIPGNTIAAALHRTRASFTVVRRGPGGVVLSMSRSTEVGVLMRDGTGGWQGVPVTDSAIFLLTPGGAISAVERGTRPERIGAVIDGLEDIIPPPLPPHPIIPGDQWPIERSVAFRAGHFGLMTATLSGSAVLDSVNGDRAFITLTVRDTTSAGRQGIGGAGRRELIWDLRQGRLLGATSTAEWRSDGERPVKGRTVSRTRPVPLTTSESPTP